MAGKLSLKRIIDKNGFSVRRWKRDDSDRISSPRNQKGGVTTNDIEELYTGTPVDERYPSVKKSWFNESNESDYKRNLNREKDIFSENGKIDIDKIELTHVSPIPPYLDEYNSFSMETIPGSKDKVAFASDIDGFGSGSIMMFESDGKLYTSKDKEGVDKLNETFDNWRKTIDDMWENIDAYQHSLE